MIVTNGPSCLNIIVRGPRPRSVEIQFLPGLAGETVHWESCRIPSSCCHFQTFERRKHSLPGCGRPACVNRLQSSYNRRIKLNLKLKLVAFRRQVDAVFATNLLRRGREAPGFTLGFERLRFRLLQAIRVKNAPGIVDHNAFVVRQRCN